MSISSATKVLVMAGGTGGHVFPALAVARELREQGAEVIWLGTARGIESRVVPEAGIPLFFLRVEGVRGRGVKGLLKAPFLIVGAIAEALRLIKKEQPDVVIGFGGFASGPGGIAARLAGKSLLIHEQNAVPGTTNRLLAPLARRVLSAFPVSLRNSVAVGNPVRSDIAALPAPAIRYLARNNDKQPLKLLVLGGSLGALAINELMPQVLALIDEAKRPEVWHQAGEKHWQATSQRYQETGVTAKVDAFIGDMSEAYGWADLIICRAGALTVSEVMAAGVAAIFIPLPSAIDDHQTFNAKVLVEAGAARSFAQRALTAAQLAALLTNELSERELLLTMAEKARQLARPDAAAEVSACCLEVANG